MKSRVTRREVIGGAAAFATPLVAKDDKPAVLGGTPVRTARFPGWPEIRENDERGWMEVLRSKKWYRMEGSHVKRFEDSWAQALGAKHCLATSAGTTALYTSLAALDVGPGDEVLVPPYTFVATINAVLLHHALPVFVDSDVETFQIDARKVEERVTSATRCILPVHLGGNAADLDTLLAIGDRRSIPVLEDACQAHWAEWKGRKVSTLGTMGCFSFQASKNLNSGEGGAILTNRTDLYERCFAYHNNGSGPAGATGITPMVGCNLRMTEFQGALLSEQLTRLDQQALVRSQNAEYLSRQLEQIPGIHPAKQYPGCTRNAYHLYMFRYEKAAFAGVPKPRFLQALSAEGIPSSGGYRPLNQAASLQNTLKSRAFQTVFGARRLAAWADANHCPANDRLCDEAVWLFQTMLLGTRGDMDQISEAIRKIQKNAASLKA